MKKVINLGTNTANLRAQRDSLQRQHDAALATVKVLGAPSTHNLRLQHDGLQRKAAAALASIVLLDAEIATRGKAGSMPKVPMPKRIGAQKYPPWCHTKASQAAYRKQLIHGQKLAANKRAKEV